MVVEPIYNFATPFSGGLSLVDTVVDAVHRSAYLDTTGKVVWQDK